MYLQATAGSQHLMCLLCVPLDPLQQHLAPVQVSPLHGLHLYGTAVKYHYGIKGLTLQDEVVGDILTRDDDQVTLHQTLHQVQSKVWWWWAGLGAVIGLWPCTQSHEQLPQRYLGVLEVQVQLALQGLLSSLLLPSDCELLQLYVLDLLLGQE